MARSDKSSSEDETDPGDELPGQDTAEGDQKPEDTVEPGPDAASEDHDDSAVADETEAEIVEAELVEDTPAETEPEQLEDEPADARAEEPDEPEVQEPDPVEGPVEEPIASEPAPQPRSGGGLLSGLIGGAIAVALGFFSLPFWPDQTRASLGLSNSETQAQITAQSEQIATQTEALQQLDGRIGTNETAIQTLPELSTSIETLGAQIADFETRLSALQERFDALPEAEIAELPAFIQEQIDTRRAELAALQDEMAQMSDLAETQIANAEAEKQAAADAQARATARGALNTLRNAIELGGGFAEALPEIAAATEIPPILQDTAETGVPTLLDLQNQFPDLARSALQASRPAASGETTTDKLRLFFQNQVGARSLTPREGDDPDAVLSRAEAAVQQGDLAQAASLISALPEAGQTALADWLSASSARVEAVQALNDITQALGVN